jgi:hypothetical protein
MDERHQAMAEPPPAWDVEVEPLGVQLEFWNPARAEREFLRAFQKTREAKMSNQVLVAGVALIAFGAFFVGYGFGWAQCMVWRDQLDEMPSDYEINRGDARDRVLVGTVAHFAN